MPQAIALLKTTRPTFYRWLRAGKIKGMKAGRQWRFFKEDIERFLKGQEPRVDLPADLTPLIKTLRERLEQAGVKDFTPSGDTEVAQAVGLMIRLGVTMRTSDIHLGPYVRSGGQERMAVLSYRVDGVLNRVAEFDIRLLAAIVAQWKTMAACNVQEKLRPQDGRILISLGDVQKEVDLRVSFLPAVYGESVTVRILDASAVRLDLDRIGYAPRMREKLLRCLKAPWGVILLTGPTGSGKTTALYACLNHVASPQLKVITVENPVEFMLPNVLHTEVRAHLGATFAVMLRAVLRSDPDVVLVGEIRDRETLLVSQQTALTGHLVLTTLHTNDAAAALTRMVDIGSDPFIIGDSTKLIIAQRLVRLLCPECSVERMPSRELLDDAAKVARAGGLDWDSLPQKFREPVGCAKCSNLGFRGRNVIAEALEVTPEIATALRRGAKPEELRAIAVGQGMVTMAADGIQKAAMGKTSLREVLVTVGMR
jgi:excisionase family DNA binding protein